jgi:uncharacterized membrane protein YhaH (DUF805 family)
MTLKEAASILEVDIDADFNSVRKSYLKKAREHHPDKHSGKPEKEIEKSNKKMAELNHAMEVFKKYENSRVTNKVFKEEASEGSYEYAWRVPRTDLQSDINQMPYAYYSPPKFEHKLHEGIVPIGLAYKSFIKNAFVLSATSTRAEYWWVAIPYFLIVGLVGVLFGGLSYLSEYLLVSENSVYSLEILILFIIFIPFTSLSVRRLHDINVTGWWFLALGPVGSIIVMLIFSVELFPETLTWWLIAIMWSVLIILSLNKSKHSKYPPLLR